MIIRYNYNTEMDGIEKQAQRKKDFIEQINIQKKTENKADST